MTHIVEFDFQNGLAMQMKTFNGKQAEVEKWIADNKITDAKILKVKSMEVR